MAKSRKKKRGGGPVPPKPRPASKPAKKRPRDPSAPTRTERVEAAKTERRRKQRRARAGYAAVAVFLIGAVVAWQVVSWRNSQRTIAALTAGSCRYDTETDPGRPNEHSSSATYSIDPPSGGVHPSTPATAGVYTAETSPPDGQVVHALEHGYVALYYRPDLAADKLSDLQEVARDNSRDVLLMPRPSLEQSVAAAAWHRRLLCDELEVANISRFVEAYVGKGPERVPRN